MHSNKLKASGVGELRYLYGFAIRSYCTGMEVLRACCDHVLGEVILGVVIRYVMVIFWAQKFAGVTNRV